MVMESEYKALQHEHISFEEVERVLATKGDLEISDDDWELFLRVNEMADTCSICRRRYKLFVNLQSTFASFLPKKHSLNERVTRYLKDFLEHTDQSLREKLTSWLEGSRDFINDLGQMTLQPALAGATRGLGDTENAVDLEVPVIGDDGFFMFELQQEAKLNFSIRKETVNGQPVCLAVFGQNGTDFSAVYPLTPLGRDYLLAETDAALPAGEYALCVPAIPTKKQD